MFVTGVGVCLNLLLASGKLVVGILTGSISIITDSVNNFSDSVSSIISSVSFFLSGRKADKEHPYGHGRYEYVAGLIIGISIIFVGLQFVIESVNRIISPSAVDASVWAFAILAASIAIKMFMFFFYRFNAKKLNSSAIKAASVDSLTDCLITFIVLIGVGVYQFFPSVSFSVDGICGVAVAGFVIFSGGKVVLETIGKLLGNGADLSLCEKVYDIICEDETIIGAHDLRLHDYGPGAMIGSAHAEFDKNITIVKAHEIIDRAEKRILSELGVELVLHADPVDVSDPKLRKLRNIIDATLKMYHRTSIHELKFEQGNKILFDIKLPQRYEEISERIIVQLKDEINKKFPDFSVGIGIDLIQ